MAEYDAEDLEQMGSVTFDGTKVNYDEDGTAFIPATAVSWPDRRIYTCGGLFIERKNGWFGTYNPSP